MLGHRFFRGPLSAAHWFAIRKLSRLRFRSLTGQLIEREALADNLTDSQIESVLVIEAQAVIAPKSLLIQITEQVEGLDRNVCTVNAPFEETPEIFQSVRVNLTANVFHRVVDHFVLEFIQSVIRFQSIGEESGTGKHMLADFAMERFLLGVPNNLCADFSAAFQNFENGSLNFAACAGDLPLSLFPMHIA